MKILVVKQGLVFYTTTGREKFKLDFLETNLTDGTVWNLTFDGKKYSSNLNNNSDLLGIDNNLTLKSLDVSSYNSTGSLNRFYNAFRTKLP